MDDNREALLSWLERQGESFSARFPNCTSHKTHVKSGEGVKESDVATTYDIEEEEWLGFSDGPSDIKMAEMSRDHVEEPEIVIFDHTTTRKMPVQKRELFMSSKISRLKATSHEVEHDQSEKSEEESHTRNDALLHRLIHTELLSGSLGNELAPTSTAQRRKALAGRVLELREDVKLGQGEAVVRKEERNHASKSVREGMLVKEKQRRAKALAKAKEVGNFHPSLRKIYGADKELNRRKRDRGLSMGVGHFTGGTLKLSKHDIKTAQGLKSAHVSRDRKYKAKP